ncbi:P-loop containing nucleoside triphosphate hydrolase protein [Elsinoe ampelina]|uniref:P-loop containing nucleoside triphosphate hydrolase protein n=1 Tax=Elsinoe ampelina TaxID=302913 RepID=A0A6A6G308_9PEZI|nr:P-loop containing nucleoside triphosphate hydrolase protein [Elsinoe ampelina]
MIRSKTSSSMQKTYDDCYLICSTAVYFESQNNEPEALRSWRSALDAIYYHNAYKLPSGWRPRSETEKALHESLRQMEVRCKERVDLLEALRESREDAKKASTTDLSGQKGTNSATPVVGITGSSDAPPTPGWLGDGTVPPADYASIPKPTPPPTLPPRPMPTKRPSFTSRNSSSKDARTKSSPIPASSATFPPPSASLAPRPETTRKSSRTPSPEKKGMLRTLRSGKDRRDSGRTSSSTRSRPPAAAKAATQAWTGTGFGTSEISLISTNGEGRSTRQRSDRPSVPQVLRKYSDDEYGPSQRDRNLRYGSGSDARRSLDDPRRPHALRHQSSAASFGSTGSFSHEEVDEPPAYTSESPSAATKQPMVMPTYRQEYLPPQPSKYKHPPLATPPRRWDQRASSAPSNANQPLSPSANRPATAGIPRKAVGVVAATQARQQLDSSELQPVLEHSHTAPAKPRTKPKALDPSISSSDPSPPQSSPESPPSPEALWLAKKESVLKHLPPNIDAAAAKQILNEVVVRGDPVRWDDISGLSTAKLALKENVIYPFLRPDLFRGLREPARGILLFGPPGTGKTMLARALASESRSTFFSIGAGSLTSKYLGESEKLVRALFAVAKLCGPSIVFVDEIESLLGRRGEGGHDALERVKTEFLVGWSDLQRAAAGRIAHDDEGDGKTGEEEGDASRVLVLAATNLPWLIDEAARRRFVRRQYIPLPEGETRKQQLRKLLERQRASLAEEDLERLVLLTDGFSGSDITSLAKDAAMGPLRALGERLLDMSPDEIRPISFQDFEASLLNIRPSVSKAGLKEFEEWAAEFGERGG